MSAIIQIKMGEDLDFFFSRQGLPLTGWICTIFVKQYPKDAPTITREIAINSEDPLIWSGQLSSTETAALKTGLWWITGILTNAESDEEAQDPIRFQVSPSWNGQNPMPISELNEYIRKGRDVDADTPLSIVHQGNLIRVDTTDGDVEVDLPASGTLDEDFRVVITQVSTEGNKINVTRDAGDTINKVAANTIIDTPFFLTTFFIAKGSTDWTMAVVNVDFSNPGPIGDGTPSTIDAISYQGAGGAKITQFDDDDGLTADSPTRGVTQQAAKTYIDTILAAAVGLLLAKSANLGDLADVPTAQVNLGLGSAAVLDSGTASGEVPTNADLPSASETVEGLAEIATQAETDTGTDDTRIVTPKKLNAWSGGGLLKNYIIDPNFTQFPEGTVSILVSDDDKYGSALLRQRADKSLYTADVSQAGIGVLIDVTALETLDAAEFVTYEYAVTGIDFAEIDQQPVIFGFQHAHSVAGTWYGYFQNSAEDRSYVFEYTQSVADAVEFSTVTLILDTGGTWLTTQAGIGLRVGFTAGMGSDFATPAGVWTAGKFYGTAATNIGTDSTAINMRFGKMRLYKGTDASQFFVPLQSTVADEVDWYIQRYDFTESSENAFIFSTGLIITATNAESSFLFRKRFRASPIPTTSAVGNFQINDGLLNRTLTSIGTAATSTTTNQFQIEVGFTGALVIGNSCAIKRLSNNTPSYLQFDARHYG